MRVFIAGGTGLVGSRLVKRLQEKQHQAVVLTRRPEAARQKWGDAVAIVDGNPTEKGAWVERVVDCDAVVNLTGENIFARRWNAEFKETLRSSRVKSTENIVETLARNPRRTDGQPKVLVNASAIGYYGPHGAEELTEASPPGNDALGKLCVDWERAASVAVDKGVRLVIVRIGVVLDRDGGALKQMLLPFKLFVGGKVGSGQQYVSWIHHDDLVGMIVMALENNQANGPMNGTAPNPVTNKDMAKAIGRALGRPSFMPAPAFGLRIMLGEVADVVTTGQRVLPRKAQEWGYQFKFADIDSALRDVFRNEADMGIRSTWIGLVCGIIVSSAFSQTADDALAGLLNRLQADPKNEMAHLELGKLLFFERGKWNPGLFYLAQGSDKKLRILSQRDLAQPTLVDDRVEVGDGWWDLAEKEMGQAQRHLRLRAVYWYTLALPEVTGLRRGRLESRIRMGP